ncbi:NAD-dependent epimerase/dehydratase family protein [Microbacterium horticulturae]|uniref:NAD-dependent epimerase/dehydratase family protein n=1 Tax=Microbacterium horticulturae TaxID=3028316 RepID=A0ABY8C1H5_9MICO|nr:NAD-dependent epimerase/dehydratase family protein [Microbacterium sp. KACC 23027]WEG10100.1 NAD-dependent epimerase/dehydratase family protein [Microbacterium sp. KACC 23027]
MRLLVLGGTGWLGRAVATLAAASGHDVTCVARGGSAPAGAALVRADRELDDALAPLAAQRWDAVVDVATQPVHVRRAVRDLAPVAARYVYVSSVSAYADQTAGIADESAPLFAPLAADAMRTMDDFGPAKAACEQLVRTAFPAQRHAIVRPGLIGGPGDRTGRTTYWPRRFARPSNPRGRVLVPDAADLPTAIVDVRDLAAFVLALAAGAGYGAFNALGEPVPLSEHLALAHTVAGGRVVPTPVAEEWLLAREVGQWMGPRSLPLWIADRDQARSLATRVTDRARRAGLMLRPLADTLADVLAEPGPVVQGAGLTDDEERELLAER